MKSEYIENFDGIRASEEAKQKAINALINYVNKTADVKTAKKQKRFKWSIGRIAAAASTAAVLVFCAIFIPIILNGGYGGGKDKAVKDYYEEYSFELPFKHTVGNNQYTTLYFNTEFTMEQMCESINESGYTASLHDNYTVKKILITITKNGFSYYFIICDKIYVDGAYEDGYVLSACSASINISRNTNAWERYQYVFLFPLHLSNTVTDDPNTINIYCAFDEFAEFYNATGKNDAQIDYGNKTVIFSCRDSANESIDRGWIKGNVILQYLESENGNYINIQPQ